MSAHHQIVIIGAGTAGITVAAQLMLKEKSLDVVIIDPAAKHYYQPAWTLVGAGTYNYKETERDMAPLIPKGVKWIQNAVKEVQPDDNKLVLNGGEEISYDYLVVCPGLVYDFTLVEGLEATINKNGVCSNYTDPLYTWQLLQEFKGGTAVFTLPATPIKCGGAPQKIMYLADEYFRKTKVRDKTNIVFITPGAVIFGVDPFKDALMEVVDRKNINLRFFHKLMKIDPVNKVATYAITANQNAPDRLHHNKIVIEGEQYFPEVAVGETPCVTETLAEVMVPFDLLHLAPPQVAPDFVRHSKLSYRDGPDKGWMAVDINSLQNKTYANVFGLGDVAALPTAKTGAAVRKQSPVVVENLLHMIHNEGVLSKDYTGYSSCPLVTGYGKMILAEFGYENKRMSDPLLSKFFDTSKELYSMWVLKKFGLPYMYWNLMLKGKA
ncbi:MAG: NAD(P)/FAD-dependent oxidoreductase [Haliscomenobacter sp.]|nr:NAD(P)/FAD-dependent oxidoreductase [Haliscomenobacter sp.]